TGLDGCKGCSDGTCSDAGAYQSANRRQTTQLLRTTDATEGPAVSSFSNLAAHLHVAVRRAKAHHTDPRRMQCEVPMAASPVVSVGSHRTSLGDPRHGYAPTT